MAQLFRGEDLSDHHPHPPRASHHCPAPPSPSSAYYEAAGGQQWHDQRGWMEARGAPVGSLDPRKWSGLTVAMLAGKPGLTELCMPSNECKGSLPICLFDRFVVGNLKTLVLPGNKFSGELPDAWDAMPRLRELDLSNNFLDQKLPPTLGTLKNLEQLTLSNNGFVGPLDVLGALTGLRNLVS